MMWQSLKITTFFFILTQCLSVSPELYCKVLIYCTGSQIFGSTKFNNGLLVQCTISPLT